jgi:hypothetical protein
LTYWQFDQQVAGQIKMSSFRNGSLEVKEPLSLIMNFIFKKKDPPQHLPE